MCFVLPATWRPAGHLLGSAILELVANDGNESHRIRFSGDLGRYHASIRREISLRRHLQR
jgi:Cft2 family RNA processing exonuclease